MEGVSALQGVADRVSRGDALSEDDARAILATHDIVAIGMLADEVRRQRRGIRTTFVRVFETHVDAPAKALPGRLDAGELRIVGKPADAHAAIAAVSAAASLAGPTPVSGFSLADLSEIAGSTSALTSLCEELREAGLNAVAEVPIDALKDAATAVQAARRRGLSVLRITVQSMPESERTSIVAAARGLQNAVGGFRAFAPLPRTMSIALPTTGYDDVKQVALARLMVDNIDSIQVDWPLYGPKLAQVALTMGADDVDGVAAVDPGTLGTRRSPLEEITGNIRAASLDPAERNALFEAR
jgi:aminodeoxyfutalosine synthase